MTDQRPGGLLDVVTRVAPIGIRLWDLHLATAAPDRVRVSHAWAVGAPRLAVRTPSGVQTLPGLPGLAATERGAGDGPFWYHPPVERAFRLSLRDADERYVPMDVDVRAPFRGLYRPQCVLPELDAPVVPVFSSCSRPVPAGFAAVRAQLELDTGGPASWARLDVVLPDGTVARGVADGEGRVAVLFPHPEPPPSMTVPLTGTSWLVGLRAWFGAGGSRRAVAGRATPPELCDVLHQRPARLRADAHAELVEASLFFGRELVLRTAGLSTQLITGSP
jgi:hypothetical protein